MWPVIGQIILGLISLAAQYFKREKDPDVYEKARDAQAKVYQEQGAILEGSSDELTRMAAVRARLLRSLLRTRSIKNAKTS